MHKGVILLVEDDENDIMLTKRAFKKKNILNEVVVARDGVEALDLLLGRNGREEITPVLILLDLKMPRMGGIEVLAEIKKNEKLKVIPTVILTTSTEEDDKVKSYALGANSYVRKPVDFNDFTDVASQLGIYWLAMNELPVTKE